MLFLGAWKPCKIRLSTKYRRSCVSWGCLRWFVLFFKIGAQKGLKWLILDVCGKPYFIRVWVRGLSEEPSPWQFYPFCHCEISKKARQSHLSFMSFPSLHMSFPRTRESIFFPSDPSFFFQQPKTFLPKKKDFWQLMQNTNNSLFLYKIIVFLK